MAGENDEQKISTTGLSDVEKRKLRREARQKKIINGGGDRLSQITQLMYGKPANSSNDNNSSANNDETAVANENENEKNHSATPSSSSPSSSSPYDLLTSKHNYEQVDNSKQGNDPTESEKSVSSSRATIGTPKSVNSLSSLSSNSTSSLKQPAVQSPSISRTPVTEKKPKKSKEKSSSSSSKSASKSSKRHSSTKHRQAKVLPLALQVKLYESSISKWKKIHLFVALGFAVSMFYYVWSATTELHFNGFETLGRLLSENNEEVRVPAVNIFYYFLYLESFLLATRIVLDKITLYPPVVDLKIATNPLLSSLSQKLESLSFIVSRAFGDLSILMIVFGLGIITCKITDILSQTQSNGAVHNSEL